jgi:hypothetical protein
MGSAFFTPIAAAALLALLPAATARGQVDDSWQRTQGQIKQACETTGTARDPRYGTLRGPARSAGARASPCAARIVLAAGMAA